MRDGRQGDRETGGRKQGDRKGDWTQAGRRETF